MLHAQSTIFTSFFICITSLFFFGNIRAKEIQYLLILNVYNDLKFATLG